MLLEVLDLRLACCQLKPTAFPTPGQCFDLVPQLFGLSFDFLLQLVYFLLQELVLVLNHSRISLAQAQFMLQPLIFVDQLFIARP